MVEKGWPAQKMTKFISDLSADSKSGSNLFAVLLTTGALNPFHNGHLDILERARRTVENQHGFTVLGGFISPSHELYVRGKCERQAQFYFPTTIRVKLAQLACRDSDWIECGTWESSREGYWPDFPEVLSDLQRFLSEWPSTQGLNINVLYVCGLDHALRCGLSNGMGMESIGVVILPRSGEAPTQSIPSRLVFAATEDNAAVAQLSSTEVRKALERGQAIPEAWMPAPVAAELTRAFASLTTQ